MERDLNWYIVYIYDTNITDAFRIELCKIQIVNWHCIQAWYDPSWPKLVGIAQGNGWGKDENVEYEM